MSVVPADEITRLLTDFQSSTRGVTAALLASTQGRLHGSTLPSGPARLHLTAISAAALAIAGKGARDLQLGQLGQVHILGASGSILLLNLGEKAVLSLVLADGVAAGPVLEAGKRVFQQLESLI